MGLLSHMEARGIVWNLGDKLGCLLVLHCAIVVINEHVATKPEKGLISKAPDSSGRKV